MLYQVKKIEVKLLICAAMFALFASAVFYIFYTDAVPTAAIVTETEEGKMPAVPILMYHSVCDNATTHGQV